VRELMEVTGGAVGLWKEFEPSPLVWSETISIKESQFGSRKD